MSSHDVIFSPDRTPYIITLRINTLYNNVNDSLLSKSKLPKCNILNCTPPQFQPHYGILRYTIQWCFEQQYEDIIKHNNETSTQANI